MRRHLSPELIDRLGGAEIVETGLSADAKFNPVEHDSFMQPTTKLLKLPLAGGGEARVVVYHRQEIRRSGDRRSDATIKHLHWQSGF